MSNIFTSVEGGIVGGAAGIATARAVEPLVEPEAQEVWEKNPYRVLDPEVLARLVAQALTDFGDAQAQAQRSGIDSNKFAALVQTLLTTPGLAELDQMLNRQIISREQFDHALAKHQIEPQYWDALYDLLNDRLSPPVVALAIVRGIMPDPGFLPVGPPSATGKVPAFPVSGLDPLKEAAAAGWDRDRLFVQTAIMGRPMGPEAAAGAVFRGILDRVDFDRAVAEGDVRNEWADAIFEQSRQIASVADYVAAHLRGHITEAEMLAGAKRHGMSDADVRLIFLRSGRPAAPVQMTNAWARGVVGPEGRPMDEAQFLLGIAESDIRPEWGPMLWGIRHAYPSLFQLRGAVQAGALTPQRALTILKYERYEDQDAQALVASWAGGGATGAKGLTAAELTSEYEGLFIDRATYLDDLQALGYSAASAAAKAHAADARRTKRYRDAAIARWNKRYDLHRATQAEVRDGLGALDVPQGAIDLLVTLWELAREAKTAVLTPAQVKKAWKSDLMPRADALVELEQRGYSSAEAATFLDE